MDMTQVRRQMLMATPHEATAIGNPATFDTDGVWPLKSLKVGFEPVQDLHGYDNPWPAGGGKNKANITAETIRKPTWYDGGWSGVSLNDKHGITQTRGYQQGGAGGLHIENLSAGTYTFSMTFLGETPQCMLYSSCIDENGNSTTIVPNRAMSKNGTRHMYTFVVPEGTIDICFRPTIWSASGSYDLEDVQLESGSTATAWTPYSNICPITGWTGMTVKCTGENLITCNGTSETVNGVTFEHDGNSVHISGANTSGKVVRHTFSTDLVYKQGLVLTGVPGMKPDGLYGTTSAVRPDPGYKNADVVKGKYYDSDIAQLYSWRVYINADYDGTPFTYTPIVANGALYIVDWADEAGTVYGGTLDVVTGQLVVDRATVDMGTLNWRNTNFNKQTGFAAYNLNGGKSITGYNGIMEKAVCSIYSIGSNGSMTEASSNMLAAVGAYYTSGCNVYVRDSRFTDAATFKSAMSGVQLVYELATPITYHLTPQQVLSLVGTNTIFSDTNGGCDATYWVHGR